MIVFLVAFFYFYKKLSVLGAERMWTVFPPQTGPF